MMSIKRKGTKCIIYVRVSKSRSDQTSLGTQEKLCVAYAESMGWEVVKVFIENGRSAFKKNVKRPMFDAAMLMIERKQADVFLVWKLDRFYRSGTEFHKAWNRIDEAGAQFASVMEPYIDTSSAQGRQMLSGIAYQAEIESENRAQRAKAWDDERTSEGGTPGGKTPYGFVRSNRGQLTINDDEATLIRTAVDQVLSGVSLRKTHRDLSSQLFTTMTRNDETVRIPMTVRGLRHVIQSPTTAGFRRLENGSLQKGCWDGIITEDQFIAIQVLFADPDRRTGKTNQVQHLLSGILQCNKCDSPMGIRKWKMNPTKRNPVMMEGHRYTCQCGNSIGAEVTEAIVTDRLWEIVTPDVWQQWMTTGNGWDQSVIDDIQQRYDTAVEMQLMPSSNTKLRMSPEKLDAMIEAIELEMRLATGEEPLDLPKCEDIRDEWETLSIKDQRKVIRHAFGIGNITLNPSNGTRDAMKRIKINNNEGNN